MIQQGDVYWIELGEPVGSSPGYVPPHVVIQANVFNQSRIRTVVVSQIFTVDRSQLREWIGKLSINRVRQILDGAKLLTEPREIE